MKISLIKDNKLLVYRLPSIIGGNIWLKETDNKGIERNIVNIRSNGDNKWELISNSDYFLTEDNKQIPSKVLEVNECYSIYSSNAQKSLLLFTSEIYEKNMTFYDCHSKLKNGISIGKSNNCDIIYNMPYISDVGIIIKEEDGKIFITSNNAFLNGIKVDYKNELNIGDSIFYLGLNILMIKINDNILIGINNPNNNLDVKLETYNIDYENEKFEETSDEKEMTLYNQEDYFYKKPRFIYSIDKLNINVDSPPAKNDNDEMPVLLTVGPMLTMSLTSLVTIYSTITNINNGSQTFKQAIPSLVISGVMMLSFLLWPLITNLFNKRLKKKKERKRQQKYSEYIESIKKKIANEKLKQEDSYNKSYPNLETCENIILNKSDRLWEKRIFDNDFLEVSLGTGTLPMKIDINIPTEHFSISEDNLLAKMGEIQNYNALLENVPIPYSFKENYITAIVGDAKLRKKMIENILLQLITFHSYDSLKIAVFTSKNELSNWDSLRALPHIWSNNKNIRFLASEEDEYKELTYQLDRVYQERLEFLENNNSLNISDFNQSYLIIVDSYTAVRNFDLFNHIINNKKYLGFSIIILNDRISNLPDQCQTFIELNEKESEINKNVANADNQKFIIDSNLFNLTNLVTILSKIPIEFKDEGEGIIPKKVGFLEMYGLGKVEQFNSKIRWQQNNPVMNMSVPVGIGNNGEKISLDLHEKFHGPHGLIAGMTGSGKSEFIITYILSLALNYHPNEVQFILIDYKGGGLAGAFENQTTGIKLPHLVGIITNLDKNEINRSLQSIESELKRRQALFNKAREISEESTIDIYKYQDMYRKGILSEPVSHLFIIADEFAELKQQQPEFMEQLISTARIGRSLGVHLILATQKPSGVVDAQIWSNTRFRVCLRVQEKGDSVEVVKRPDAAYLTQTGRFYLQVGFNEVFTLGQSAWAGANYIPSENIRKNIDTTVNFINNIGYHTKNVETKKEVKNQSNLGSELINIVKYLSNIADEEDIRVNQLWLNRIPSSIFVNDLVKKYNYKKENYIYNPIIGEYDLPESQSQKLLTIPFSEKGNALLYGIAGSGKENFITTMIYSSMLSYTPTEVNFYILDFGSETLKYFKNSPFIGDVVDNDSEKIENLFKMIQSEMDRRKKLLSEFNGDYASYLKNSNDPLPNIIIVINNFENFIENYPSYDETLNVITRECSKYGIYFLLAINTPNGIRFKLKQNFGQIFALQQNNDDDFNTILGNVKKLYPSKIFGRGLIKTDNTYEFQTALATSLEEIPNCIKELNEKQAKEFDYHAKKIPILPEIISYDMVKDDVRDNNIALGINKDDLSISTYDFIKDKINVITSQDSSSYENVLEPLILQFIHNDNYSTIVINAADIEFNEEVKKANHYSDSEYDKVFETITSYIEFSCNKFIENNKNKDIFNNSKKVVCIIIGLSSFKNKLSSENQTKFDKLFEDNYELRLINFVIVDTVNKISKFAYEPWFKENYTQNNGIYLGNGINEQMIINISKRIPSLKEEIENNFGFVIQKGIPSYVKFIEKYK